MAWFTEINLWQQDIKRYEYVQAILQIMGIASCVMYLFYKTIWGTAFLLPLLPMYIVIWRKEMELKRKKEFEIQFRDYLQSLSTALRTGYALENAMREARSEMEKQYDEDTRIMQDTLRMERLLQMNMPVEQAWMEWQKALDIEVLNQFVTVFVMAKKTGGDSIGIIRKAIQNICERMEMNQDIEILLTAKKLEFQVMTLIPLGILLYMKWSFAEFMDVLYGNLFGISVMTVCLLVYGIAYIWGRNIVDIEM